VRRWSLLVELGVLTSRETRHRHFARLLCGAFDVRAVCYQNTGYAHSAQRVDLLTRDEASIVARHFTERDVQERRFFGHDACWVEPNPNRLVLHASSGSLNSSETVEILEHAGIDALAVFGTTLLKEPILSRWPGHILNLHLGLSPYYRGTATNFYPLYNEEPQYIGATIHVIDAGIDSGPVVRHVRPAIVAEDQPHTIGCKAIDAGIEAMIRSLRELEGGTLRGVPQWSVPNARLYLRRDYHPRQVVELYRKLEAGLIPRYVARSAEYDGAIRLVG
jgi:folate-dependent phosphoribosylglycinamide formyltransferase PurN